jgi:hypothetical protein
MDLVWTAIGFIALIALAGGGVILYWLARGWDNEAPGDPNDDPERINTS